MITVIKIIPSKYIPITKLSSLSPNKSLLTSGNKANNPTVAALAIPKLILKIDDAVFSKVVFSFFSIAAVREGNSVEEKLTPITNPNCIKG